MSPVPKRRSWLPGGALLLAAVLLAVLSGLGLGVHSWPWYAGFTAAAVLGMGWAERVWQRHTLPPPARLRGKLKVIQGGKAAHYDLARDHSTDSQRYLM